MKDTKFLDPYTLSDEIRGASFLENFKPSLLTKFDGRNNPYKHVPSINLQMEIIWVSYSFKWKLISRTFKDAILRWYMTLLQILVTNYMDLVKQLVHQFVESKYRKISTTGLFNIW